MKLIKNSGQVYEFESDSKSRFLNKIKNLSKDPHIFWLIEGYKINDLRDIEKWMEGEFVVEKLEKSKSYK